MRKAHKRRGLGVALILAAAAALAIALATATPMAARATVASSNTPAASTCGVSAQQVISSNLEHHIRASGVLVAAGTGTGTCAAGTHKPPPEPPFNGNPPLIFRGPAGCFFTPCWNGNVMMTASTGPLIVVPIFWDPTGYPMSSTYKNLIVSYLAGVAKDSGGTQNVFSVLNEYSGLDGQIHYNIKLGPVINDTDPLPTSGCTLNPVDTSLIYADGTGYSACLDDAQLQAEVENIRAANSGFPNDLTHIYVLYLPKHVESCFIAGETLSSADGQACTINHEPPPGGTAAYCAYHNNDFANAIYANLAYPIYDSIPTTGFTCGSEVNFGEVESPNANLDADVEISPTSHEISEAITDPDGETGWIDKVGFEIGDECAYIYGRTRGAPGAFFNQVINGGHFLTQEEASNNVFASSGGTASCVQSQSDEH